MKQFYVYLLASGRNGTLYIGMTSNLPKRVWEHKEKVVDGFTKRHGVDRLVYYEVYETAEDAIVREKRMKKLYRKEKLALIEKDNPQWNDLYEDII